MHGVACSFPGYMSASAPDSEDCATASSDTTNYLSNDFSTSILELELIHHYCTSTCYTLSQNAQLQTIWRIDIPQIGFSFPFVIRAILAISALHLAHCKPSKRDFFVETALRLHEAALRDVNKLLLNIDRDNCAAIYCLSALTCLISCAKPRGVNDFLLIGDSGLAEWLILFRGSRSIIFTYIDTLRRGPLAAMFSIGQRRTSSSTGDPPALPQPLQDLKCYLSETPTSPELLHVQLTAVDELSKSFAIVFDEDAIGKPHDPAEVFVWLFRVSAEYLNMLGQRSPEALAIFAHYCVLLKQLEWAWWMQGWSMHLIAGVYHTLGYEHRAWIRWPMEQIGWVPD